MYILGAGCYYHDSSAALLKDGRVVAAAEEERFTRRKHDTAFPHNAIRYCLDSQGITIDQVDKVVFYEKPLLKFERVLYQHLENFPRSWKVFLGSTPAWVNEKLRVVKRFRGEGYEGDVLFVPHHQAHAASAFLPSPFEEAAVVTVDGVGEWATTTVGVGKGDSVELLEQIEFPSSLGLLYSAITAYLGFRVNNSEYKVMGLASYGDKDPETNEYYRKLRQVVDFREDGSFQLDMKYFVFDRANRMPSPALCRLLGGPVRRKGTGLGRREKDIAAALQMVYEEGLFGILNHAHELTHMDNLTMAGGCALNSVANGRVLGNTPFRRLWVQPNASDGGGSLGAALHAHTAVLGGGRDYRMEHAYLGPGFTTQEVRSFLDGNGVNYSRFDSREQLLRDTAELLEGNSIVGWFQGRMEWGPRALGSRSILANPCDPAAKDTLNAKVKHREEFRPFAPVVCEDDARRFFETDRPVPEPTDFMLMVYPIKERWHERIPSVTHVDGSGRLQTVRRPQNPLYYDLIKEFGKLTRVPILINTSFNIRGEPIVCTPYDAYKCMMGTGIDYTVMDEFLIARSDNPAHMWDSESHAKG